MGVFGSPSDLYIGDNCNLNINSGSGYGSSSSSFEILNVSEPNKYLAGASSF